MSVTLGSNLNPTTSNSTRILDKVIPTTPSVKLMALSATGESDFEKIVLSLANLAWEGTKLIGGGAIAYVTHGVLKEVWDKPQFSAQEQHQFYTEASKSLEGGNASAFLSLVGRYMSDASPASQTAFSNAKAAFERAVRNGDRDKAATLLNTVVDIVTDIKLYELPIQTTSNPLAPLESLVDTALNRIFGNSPSVDSNTLNPSAIPSAHNTLVGGAQGVTSKTTDKTIPLNTTGDGADPPVFHEDKSTTTPIETTPIELSLPLGQTALDKNLLATNKGLWQQLQTKLGLDEQGWNAFSAQLGEYKLFFGFSTDTDFFSNSDITDQNNNLKNLLNSPATLGKLASDFVANQLDELIGSGTPISYGTSRDVMSRMQAYAGNGLISGQYTRLTNDPSFARQIVADLMVGNSLTTSLGKDFKQAVLNHLANATSGVDYKKIFSYLTSPVKSFNLLRDAAINVIAKNAGVTVEAARTALYEKIGYDPTVAIDGNQASTFAKTIKDLLLAPSGLEGASYQDLLKKAKETGGATTQIPPTTTTEPITPSEKTSPGDVPQGTPPTNLDPIDDGAAKVPPTPTTSTTEIPITNTATPPNPPPGGPDPIDQMTEWAKEAITKLAKGALFGLKYTTAAHVTLGTAAFAYAYYVNSAKLSRKANAPQVLDGLTELKKFFTDPKTYLDSNYETNRPGFPPSSLISGSPIYDTNTKELYVRIPSDILNKLKATALTERPATLNGGEIWLNDNGQLVTTTLVAGKTAEIVLRPEASAEGLEFSIKPEYKAYVDATHYKDESELRTALVNIAKEQGGKAIVTVNLGAKDGYHATFSVVIDTSNEATPNRAEINLVVDNKLNFNSYFRSIFQFNLFSVIGSYAITNGDKSQINLTRLAQDEPNSVELKGAAAFQIFSRQTEEQVSVTYNPNTGVIGGKVREVAGVLGAEYTSAIWSYTEETYGQSGLSISDTEFELDPWNEAWRALLEPAAFYTGGQASVEGKLTKNDNQFTIDTSAKILSSADSVENPSFYASHREYPGETIKVDIQQIKNNGQSFTPLLEIDSNTGELHVTSSPVTEENKIEETSDVWPIGDKLDSIIATNNREVTQAELLEAKIALDEAMIDIRTQSDALSETQTIERINLVRENIVQLSTWSLNPNDAIALPLGYDLTAETTG
ncbi:MAG: hypothetical protein ACRCWJ_17455, partial [Casimicrobium sp.]